MELSWTVLMVWFFFEVLPGKCNSFEYESVPNQSRDNEEDRADSGAWSWNTNSKKKTAEEMEYEAEQKAGNMADLSGSNPHWSYPTVYKDFGRRFVLQYPYTEKQQRKETKKSSEDRQLIPVKATPEEVLAVAVKSAIYEASKPLNGTDDSIRKDILRTGQFWNSVWVEEVDPQTMLRSETLEKFQDNAKGLGSVKAKVMPGSNLYQLVSVLKQFSPRLLYVINNEE